MTTVKKKKDDDGKERKGQKTLTSFFSCKPNTCNTKEKSEKQPNNDDNGLGCEDSFTADANGKENMGLDSNLRKSAIQRQKSFAKPKKNTQTTIAGGLADGRCDDGTQVCKACDFKERKGKAAKFAHDPTCKLNSHYKQTNGGRISMQQYYLDLAEEERMKQLNKPFSGEELCSGGSTQEEFDTFFAPRTAGAGKKSTGFTDLTDSVPVDSIDSIASHYETTKLIERINYWMKNPNYSMRSSSSVPMVVSAGIQSLLDLIPVRFKKGTNRLNANDKRSISYKKLQAYRKQFPPGTIGFTFRKADKSIGPDHYYSQLEGRTIYFVCWELNIQGWEPTCFKCGQVMLHDQYDFQQHGYATPIFNIDGVTDYACSMYYNCASPLCNNRCKANDGRIFFNLEPHYRNAYPVDPRYAVNKETHLAKSFSRVMDKMFVTHGNGDQLATMLNELRGDQYLQMEEEYFSQAISAGVKVAKTLPSFKYFIGRYSPTGSDLRDMKDAAAISNLVSTGVSDKDRVRREMQSVGCHLTSASDHTFEFRKNYMAGLLEENACGHTIGTNTGEIASIAIVKDTKQTTYAHQAEQCSLRPNWKPKVHTTDNCPTGIVLWKTLLKGIRCQLGLFHFTYRITKTLNKECRKWKDAVASLQTCLYYLEGKDLEDVKECLRTGALGTVKGKKCPVDKIDSKARTYRDNIRIWIYSSSTINERLHGWLVLYKEEFDDYGERLFTDATVKTVREQMSKSKWIVDTLTKDQLYLQVEASKNTRTGLNSYIGARGSESKLEKGHHAIAHFANGGMRETLADFLGMGGIALYNLRIRYRLQLAKLPPTDRAKIPVGFQKSPHYTNHLQLAHINQLGRKAGLTIDAHQSVEVLQPDNNERFFYEYYVQEEERQKTGVTHDERTNRCLCRDCGRNNPYRKRAQEWQHQDDIQLSSPIAPALPPPPPLLQLAPTPLPLPLALTITIPATLRTVPAASTSTNVGPYSAMMASSKKKKRLYKKKKD